MNLLKKLSSRKFLAAAAGVVVGVCMVFGPDEDIVNTVTGAITSAASAIAYIITEGFIDNNSLRTERQDDFSQE